MTPSRRVLVKSLVGIPLYASAAKALQVVGSKPLALPDKQSFPFEGTFLAAAFTHPISVQTQRAGAEYLASRVHDPTHVWPRTNPRDAAAKLFAELIHAEPTEIAIVPSTMSGENLVGAALGLGLAAGVVTDAFHYDASLAMYGEMQKSGIPVAVVSPKDNRIDLRDVDAALTKNIKLLAVSLVGSLTGYHYDLKKLCEMAHAKGVLVYADIVQAAGAVPVDVKESGVDFCCCGTYKWLMGDFGVAFLYVRPDRLAQLKRTQYGWRQTKSYTHHVFPFDEPGSALGTYAMKTDTASVFEVGSPDWQALAMSIASMTYIRDLGVENIARYRQPMLDRLQAELPKLGFAQATPVPTSGPTVTFAYKGAQAKFGAALKAAKVTVTLYENLMRVSPSVYNDMDDIDRLLHTLKA